MTTTILPDKPAAELYVYLLNCLNDAIQSYKDAKLRLTNYRADAIIFIGEGYSDNTIMECFNELQKAAEAECKFLQKKVQWLTRVISSGELKFKLFLRQWKVIDLYLEDTRIHQLAVFEQIEEMNM